MASPMSTSARSETLSPTAGQPAGKRGSTIARPDTGFHIRRQARTGGPDDAEVGDAAQRLVLERPGDDLRSDAPHIA